MRLKEAANWNQSEQDWINVMAVEPEGCFGIECDGVLASTATAVCYGADLAWIGMVLTHPDFRGRGFARQLMERCIEYCRKQGVHWIKLDGTDMGVPLYLKLGFEDESLVERWLRPADAPVIEAVELAPLSGDAHLTLDRDAFGADRSGILGKVAVQTASIPGCGYAMGRPGSRAAYFGPCVTPSAEAARTFLRWFLSGHAGEAVFWDVLPDNAEAMALAREFGFEMRRRLIRMTLCGNPEARPFVHNNSSVFAIAGFEYG
jgi:GNAT superfamily N-acetyltransferase